VELKGKRKEEIKFKYRNRYRERGTYIEREEQVDERGNDKRGRKKRSKERKKWRDLSG
jgi:hypothetical protein